MKNQREIYEALLAGETLILDNLYKVILKDGELYNPDAFEVINYQFDRPKDWSIYKEPKWYENIPDGGVLCWTGDCGEIVKDIPSLITNHNGEKFVSVMDCLWGKAIPLTKQEIQVYLNNAPEEE